MARIAIAITTLAGNAGLANATVTKTTGDFANDHDWLLNDGDLLVARNTEAVNPKVLTIITTADRLGRTQAIAQNHTAGEVRVYGPLTRIGYAQSDGKIHIDVDTASWELSVLRA